MRSFLAPVVGLTALFWVTVSVAENAIQLSQEQINHLGINLSAMTVVKEIPILKAPAKVVIPTANEFVVSASHAGVITQLNVATGDAVKKGQVLAQLNSPDFVSLQRQYLKALTAMALNLLAYERDKKLWQEGVIAERRWQETSSQYNALVFEANESKQLLQISGMTSKDIEQLNKTHQLSSQLNLPAPIAGVVTERLALAGTRVDVLAPLFKIANLEELWLEINVPHERIGRIRVGDEVFIDNTSTSADVMLVGQSVNPDNQAIPVRAKIRGKPPGIHPGQTINTQIIEQIKTQAFRIPNTAIAQHEGKAYIFVRDTTGFKLIPITIIGKENEDSIIAGDFSGTESIAIKGAVALKAQWLGLGSAE